MPSDYPDSLIVLVAGPVRPDGWPGHHDYLAGCRLFASMLARVPGVPCQLIENGWPEDDACLDDAATILFYDNGGGSQRFLAEPARAAQLDRLAEQGTGLVLLHQATAFPESLMFWASQRFGAAYCNRRSRRGHRRTRLDGASMHPITRHWRAQALRDGWLDRVDINAAEREFVSPLLWPAAARDRDAREAGMVAWAFAPPGRGRSFVFTGGDNHRAWQNEALRELIVIGLLWTAGIEAPANAGVFDVTSEQVRGFQTPRRAPWRRITGKLARRVRRIGRGRGKW